MRLSPKAAEVLGTRADYEQLEAFLAAPAGAVSARARDSLLLGALAEAVADMTQPLGADTTAWRWGTVHVAELRHPLARSFDLPAVSRGGRREHGLRDGRRATIARPPARRTVRSSTSAISTTRWRSTSRVSPAQPGSEYYDNLLPLWGNDQYFPLVFSRARVEQETKHLLRLMPSSNEQALKNAGYC